MGKRQRTPEDIAARKVKKLRKKEEKARPAPAETLPAPDQHPSSPRQHSTLRLKDIRRPRKWTVSIAVPGSIIGNAQSPELKTYLAGQIARAATIFNVDEIVVFSEDGKEHSAEGALSHANRTDANVFLARVLQYLECPQYLRKALFPMHPDLKFAGLLNPLDAPHHLRADAISPFREGITLKRPSSSGTLVNVGLRKDVRVPQTIAPNVRVTVAIEDPELLNSKKVGKGHAVSPSAPRESAGLYWGYTTRLAAGLSEVFTQCPYEGGYDLALGTSDRGELAQEGTFTLKPFKHLIIVFGGLGGIESCVEGDEKLPSTRAEELFDAYINTCAHQGSGTIRTEEAILVSLSALHSHILRNSDACK